MIPRKVGFFYKFYNLVIYGACITVAIAQDRGYFSKGVIKKGLLCINGHCYELTVLAGLGVLT